MAFIGSFLFYDILFLIVFTLLVVVFLHKRRKKLDREGLLYLYRTSFGLKVIESFSKKYKKTLKFFSYISVITGYLLMATMLYLVGTIVYLYYKFPEVVRAVKVPPIVPLIPYLPEIFKIDFLPPFFFTYWIIIIAIIAIPHEFAHGIFARFYNVKVKSTGFGFLGPFLAAFVEPDEKQMAKKRKFEQISVLSAGTLANLLTAIVFLLLLWGFFTMAFHPAGVVFNTYSYEIADLSDIESVNGILTSNVEETYLLLNNTFKNENKTNVIADNRSFIMLKQNLPEEEGDLFVLYHNAPAINANLPGIVTKINNKEIVGAEELAEEIKKYSPGDEVVITARSDAGEQDYKIILVADPRDSEKAFLGIGIQNPRPRGILGNVYSYLSSFKQPDIYYKPTFGGISVFIFNLLWWIVLISISVALVNMLPLGIFDGGRVFYLTVLSLTRSQSVARKSFAFMTYLLIFLVILLMVFWAVSVF